jgi:hypothetical protein
LLSHVTKAIDDTVAPENGSKIRKNNPVRSETPKLVAKPIFVTFPLRKAIFRPKFDQNQSMQKCFDGA